MNDHASSIEAASLLAAGLAAKDRRGDSLLRMKAVLARTGLSDATVYRREAAGTFPRRVQIGEKCVAWYESDIDDFVSDPMGYRAP